MSSTLPALVLAAGFSRRMGRCKLTLKLDGEPLVRRAVRAALEAGLSPVLVTVRPDASPELMEALSGFGSRVELVPAPEAHLGQAESLKAGIRRLLALIAAHDAAKASLSASPPCPSFPSGNPSPVPASPARACCAAPDPKHECPAPLSPLPSGVMILLGDQPLVGPELVRRLAAFFLERPECAAAPACGGKRGNPVVLPAQALAATLSLSGDQGARGLLGSFGLRLMPTNDTAAITDVDTWEAYESLSRAKPC